MFKNIAGTWENPSLFHIAYHSLKPLSRELKMQLSKTGDGARVLDIGCGYSPYSAMFKGRNIKYMTADLDPSYKPDFICPAEALTVETDSMDVVMSTQVLEHVSDPRTALSEIYRVLKPGGKVVLSTHGVYVWHPCPNDYWRWTHQGLEKIFSEAGFKEITIIPIGNSVTTVFQSLSTLADRLLKPGWLKFKILLPVAFIMNVTGSLADKAAGIIARDDSFHYLLATSYMVVGKK